MNFKTKTLILIIFLLVLANFYLWKFVFKLDGNLKVVFFDVGQGDSIFIETKRGNQIIIDGGPSGRNVLEKLAGEIPFWDKTLDLVILSHPDYDHLKGLIDVLGRYEVENILWTGAKKESETFKKWEEAIKKENARIIIAKTGQKIKAGGMEIFILYPFEGLNGKFLAEDSNESSIVAKLSFGENSFLFPGDIFKKTEKELADSENSLKADVLKVAHHGSKNANSKEFLAEVLPKIAVISVGKENSYGHPAEETLRNLQEFGINILRTDINGDVVISSNGTNLRIEEE